jgi:hypothetical protein
MARLILPFQSSRTDSFSLNRTVTHSVGVQVYFRLSLCTITWVIYGEGHLSTDVNVHLLAYIFCQNLALASQNSADHRLVVIIH